MRLRALILLPFLVCSSFTAASAQSSTSLQQGVPIERTLGGGQVHEFTVDAKANSYVQLVVEQKGIDVVVNVSSPDGKDLARCDTPNGAQGMEQVSFLATESGKYRVAISPLNKDDASGRYEIKLIDAREATEEEIEAAKNRAAAKAKGIALLLELREPISQIRSPHTRITAQLTAASLLKETDEKAASKFLLDAVADVKQLLAAANLNNDDADEAMVEYSALSQLRDEVIKALAETDPDAALSFLQSTSPKYSPYGSAHELVAQESALELSIADQIARKDPRRALQIARKTLKKAYSPALLSTASQIFEKDPAVATELVHDITSKLLAEEKLLGSLEASTLAMMLTGYYNAANNRGESTNTVPSPYPVVVAQHTNSGLLSEQEYKQLIQKMIREVMSYPVPANRQYDSSMNTLWAIMTGLKSMGGELDKAVSGSAAELEKKQSELVGNMGIQYVNQYQEYQNAIANNPVEEALGTIEKAPPELREQLYIMLATREGTNGDLTRAKQILNEHVGNPYQRVQALRTIEQQQIDHAMSSGKIEEALKNISAIRAPGERAAQLSQLAAQIGPGQKRATALNLLEQIRGLLPPSPQAQNQEHMGALLEIARAYSNYDLKRSFEIMDPLIEQFNDMCTAARKLEGFGLESFEDDELDLVNEGILAQVANQISDVLGSLALVNFDRAKAASDKLELAEMRLHVHLKIAEQTITAKN